MSMKYFLIMNPGSKGGKSKKMFELFFDLLNKKNIEYEYKITTTLTDAYTFSLEANKMDTYDVIVAFGGDGTVNNVLNGFYNAAGERISTTKMGIAYTGTSPDICKHYHIPIHNLSKTVDVLLRGNTRKIEIGQIVLAREKNSEYDNKRIDNTDLFHTKYFFGAVNIGIGAAVAAYANNGIRKLTGDYIGTLLSLLKALIEYKPVKYTIILDEKEIGVHGLVNLIIGKLYYVASGIKVKNHLKDGDKEFYCLFLKNFKFRKLGYMLTTLYSGNEIKKSDMFQLDYHKVIEVKGASHNPEIEFDGDPGGFLPCRITVARDTLDLIVE